MVRQISHPDAEQLAAYGRGQSFHGRSEVEQHVLTCDSCCQKLASAPDDPFSEKVRGVVRAPAAFPNTQPGQGAGNQPTGPEARTPVPSAQGLHRLSRVAGQGAVATEPAPDRSDPFVAAMRGHDRYRVLSVIGAGGMGVVYKAEHLVMHRTVALKVVAKALLSNPTILERFLRKEVPGAARLAHPNIVRALDAGVVGGTCFLVLEYVEGKTLGEWIKRKKQLDVPLACHLARQVALGLQHAHEHGMVHRDIKPDNVLVTQKGVAKIADFGLARLTSEVRAESAQITEEGLFAGSPDYVAPEQAGDARSADIRADIYSLGCTLYHSLAGQPPFPSGTPLQKIGCHLHSRPQPLREIRKEVPEELAAIIERMMAKDPAQRHATPAEVARDLVPFLPRPSAASPSREAPAKEEPPSLPTGFLQRLRVLPRRPLVALSAVLAIISLLAAGAVYVIKTDKGELIIETEDPDVKVEITNRGGRVIIIDTRTNKKIELASGTYTVELKDAPDLTLKRNSITIRRGGKEIVHVTRRPPAPGEPGNPGPGTLPPPPPSPLIEVASEFRVNSHTEGTQQSARVAMDGKGRVAVVWQSREQDGSGWGVFLRRFDSSRKPLGEDLCLSDWKKGDQIRPEIAMHFSGAFMVAWSGEGKQGFGVYGRVFDESWNPQGQEFLVNTIQLRTAEVTSLAVDSTGTFLVNWFSLGDGFHGFVRRIDRSGNPRSKPILVTGHHLCGWGECRVACGPGGRWAAVYFGQKPFGAIRAQFFDKNDSPVGEFIASRTAPGSPAGAVFDAGGNLRVVWCGKGDDHGVFCRRCNERGEALDPGEIRVNVEPGGPQTSAGVAGRASGDGMITWTGRNDGVKEDVYARSFDEAGRWQGKPLLVNKPTAGIHHTYSVAVNESGLCVITWEGSGPGDDDGIFARVFQLPTK